MVSKTTSQLVLPKRQKEIPKAGKLAWNLHWTYRSLPRIVHANCWAHFQCIIAWSILFDWRRFAEVFFSEKSWSSACIDYIPTYSKFNACAMLNWSLALTFDFSSLSCKLTFCNKCIMLLNKYMISFEVLWFVTFTFHILHHYCFFV